MVDSGQIGGGLIDGPLAFDSAVSLPAAQSKHPRSAVAGRPTCCWRPTWKAAPCWRASCCTWRRHRLGVIVGARAHHRGHAPPRQRQRLPGLSRAGQAPGPAPPAGAALIRARSAARSWAISACSASLRRVPPKPRNRLGGRLRHLLGHRHRPGAVLRRPGQGRRGCPAAAPPARVFQRQRRHLRRRVNALAPSGAPSPSRAWRAPAPVRRACRRPDGSGHQAWISALPGSPSAPPSPPWPGGEQLPCPCPAGRCPPPWRRRPMACGSVASSVFRLRLVQGPWAPLGSDRGWPV